MITNHRPVPAWLQPALPPLASGELKLLAGVILLHGGALEPARRLLSQATQLECSPAVHSAALAGLGLAALCEGDTDGATALLTRALQVDPVNWEACFHLAECFVLDGKDRAARLWLRVALEMDQQGWAAQLARSNPLFGDLLLEQEVDLLLQQASAPPSTAGPLLPGSPWSLPQAAAVSA